MTRRQRGAGEVVLYVPLHVPCRLMSVPPTAGPLLGTWRLEDDGNAGDLFGGCLALRFSRMVDP